MVIILYLTYYLVQRVWDISRKGNLVRLLFQVVLSKIL